MPSANPAEFNGGKRALVVDKEPPIRLVARSVLSTAGFQVIESDDGRHALSLARVQPCLNLLVTDVQPPNVDAYTLVEAYLQVCPSGRAVLMSAEQDVKTVNTESDGRWQFVPKSTLAQGLLDAIQWVGYAQFRRTILLAEDEPMLRNFVQAILARAGHPVLAAVDGQEALDLSRAYAGAIDLVISDIIMPRMDGIRLAEHIGRERPDTPILLMSGFYEGTVLPAHTTLLHKPFTPEKLTTRVYELLRVQKKSLLV